MINIAIKHISNVNNILSNIVNSIELPVIENTYNVYHDLIGCIIEQQIHYRSTKKVFEKMLIAADLKIVTPLNFNQFEEKGILGYKLSLSKHETLMRVLD